MSTTAPPEERTDILTPVQVERAMKTTLSRLREANDELRVIAENAARAEVAYKVGFAKARITARADDQRRVTNDEANDIAQVRTEDLLLEYKLADHALLTQREAIRSLQERLGGLRTLASGLRQLTGGG